MAQFTYTVTYIDDNSILSNINHWLIKQIFD